jgi:hypothetical protein
MKTRKNRGIRESSRKKKGGTRRSKISLTKRYNPSKKRLSPTNLTRGDYYIIRSRNPNMNIEAKFDKYLGNGKFAIFSKEVVREKIDEDTGEFYKEKDIARYNIPVNNIYYIEKIGEPITYYTTHNLPEDLQKEIESYIDY